LNGTGLANAARSEMGICTKLEKPSKNACQAPKWPKPLINKYFIVGMFTPANHIK
jgi:hypothetical protein